MCPNPRGRVPGAERRAGLAVTNSYSYMSGRTWADRLSVPKRVVVGPLVGLHLALLPSRRPFFRAVRKVTDRPTVFSGPGVRRVRDRPTDPLPGGCAVTTLALVVGSYLYFPPQTRKTVPGVGSFTRGAQRPFRNFCPDRPTSRASGCVQCATDRPTVT